MMSYFKEEIKMVQQISDAEFEIMKVIWANGEKPTLFASLKNKFLWYCMEHYEDRFDFHGLGLAIKDAREKEQRDADISGQVSPKPGLGRLPNKQILRS